MKKFKISAVVLALALMVSSAASAQFADMPTDERTATAIGNAVTNGILSGYAEDNTVRPDDNITRAQMASIITRACLVAKEADISEFSDVASDKWYHSAMAKAYQMGAFSGDDQKCMHPENNITFQECFTVLSQVFDLLPKYQFHVTEAPNPMPENAVYDSAKERLYDISVLDKFSDKDSIASWAKVFYAGVVANGGWDGIDGKLTPTAYITRGQFAIVMDNLIQIYIDTPGEYKEIASGNVMLRCSGVSFNGVKTSDSVYIADCVEPSSLSMENVSIGRLVVRGCAFDAKDDKNISLFMIGNCDSVRIIRPNISIVLSNQPKDMYVHPESEYGFMMILGD